MLGKKSTTKIGLVVVIGLIGLLVFSSGCIQSLQAECVTVEDCEGKLHIPVSGEWTCVTDELGSPGKCVWVPEEIEEKYICCKIFGYGAYMKEVDVHYEWMVPDECIVPPDFIGGGKKIVDSSLCIQVTTTTIETTTVETTTTIKQ